METEIVRAGSRREARKLLRARLEKQYPFLKGTELEKVLLDVLLLSIDLAVKEREVIRRIRASDLRDSEKLELVSMLLLSTPLTYLNTLTSNNRELGQTILMGMWYTLESLKEDEPGPDSLMYA